MDLPKEYYPLIVDYVLAKAQEKDWFRQTRENFRRKPVWQDDTFGKAAEFLAAQLVSEATGSQFQMPDCEYYPPGSKKKNYDPDLTFDFPGFEQVMVKCSTNKNKFGWTFSARDRIFREDFSGNPTLVLWEVLFVGARQDFQEPTPENIEGFLNICRFCHLATVPFDRVKEGFTDKSYYKGVHTPGSRQYLLWDEIPEEFREDE